MLKKDVYNLTNPQKNMLRAEQTAEKGSHINDINSFMKLDGNLDPEILSKTLNKIIEINDSFRLKFVEKDGDVLQYVEDYEYVPIEVIHFDKDDISDFLEDFKKLEVNLKTTFIFKIGITPSCSFVFYKSHHIISDAWGMTQVAEQIKEIYTKLSSGEDLSSYAKPSYLDFIERENKYFESNKYKLDTEFWSEYVKSMTPSKIFNAYMDKTQGTRFEYVLDDELFSKIEEFCKKNSITEYSFFLAILAIYFNKIYSKKSLVVGTPFLNRQKRNNEFEETGLHIMTMPLNINIDTFDFIKLCTDIGHSNMALYKHSGMSYYEIKKLYSDYSGDLEDLFEVGFSYQINKLTNSMESRDKGVCSWLFCGEQTQALTMHVSTLNNYKVLFYDYLYSCFTSEEIEKMNKIILNLINQVVVKEIYEIDKLTPLTDDDIDSLSTFNNTGNVSKSNDTVISIFEDIAKKYPDNVAIVIQDKSITYSELKKKINTLAALLKSRGVTLNTPVALFFDKSIEMIIAMFAVLKCRWMLCSNFT